MTYARFKEYMALNDLVPNYDRESALALTKEYLDILTSRYLQKWIDQYVKEKGQKVLYYMYTFTLKEGADPEKAEQYIKSIANRKENLNIHELAYSKEHEDKNLHFHVLIGSTRAIRSDAFKQYKQSYGFVKRSRKISETNIQIVDYLTKESDIIYLIKP